MPLVQPNGGINMKEPTAIPDNALQDSEGAEYRVGQNGIYQAMGRLNVATISGTTAMGLYEAGFDTGDFLLAQMGDTVSASPIGATFGFTVAAGLPFGSSAIIGAHYQNRHYLATGVSNLRIESSGTVGVSAYAIGLTRSTLTIGVSLTQGAGTLSAATGLVYWATEYDSARGIESMTGASVSTGAFTSLDGAYAFVTGLSANPTIDSIRWYRSLDGGGFPDGGLIATTPIGTTFYLDTLTDVSTLTVPQYGLVSIGGLDTERDEPPPVMAAIFGPFQDSLLGVDAVEPRNLRFTPAGYPDSWPADYAVPINSGRHDEIMAGVVTPSKIGVFCRDSVHVVYRLPRDSDSIFAAGDASDVITDSRGCVSRRGACMFTAPGTPALAAFVSRDGIWGTDLTPIGPTPLTDKVQWEDIVDTTRLHLCRLADDPISRRLVFLHWRAADASYPTGLWYLDYQEFATAGIRLLFADHGPLADGVTIATSDGTRRLATLDSRVGNGQVYIEGTQAVDDSHLIDSNGSVRFRFTTKHFIPEGPTGTARIGNLTVMHDAGPVRIESRIVVGRGSDSPEFKQVQDSTIRAASHIPLQRNLNSLALEWQSVGTVSYGVHWFDVQAIPEGPLGARKGT